MATTRTIVLSSAALAASVFTATSAFAALGQPSWTRPADNTAASATLTTYQAWDVFTDDDAGTVGHQDNLPDLANINPVGTATVSEPTASTFTVGGNLYNPTLPLAVSINIPGFSSIPDSTTFFVQFITRGSELVRTSSSPLAYDFSAFKIDGTAISTLEDFNYWELNRSPLGGMGGFEVEHAFKFTVPTSASNYLFQYSPLGGSNSQAQIHVDTLLPEPASLSALACAAMLGLRRRHRA